MSFLRDLFKTLLNPRARYDGSASKQASTGKEAPALPRSGLRLRHVTANFPLVLGSLILLALFLATIFGPLGVKYDPFLSGVSVIPHYDRETKKFIRPPFDPSPEYPLGSDRWGNDLLSLLVFGARVTLVAAAYIALARLVLGTVLGSVAGWYAGRWPDRLLAGMIAVFTALPALLAALILAVALGPQKGMPVFLVVLTAVGWTEVAQFVRSEMMVIRQQGFIESAEAAGLSEVQIVVRHVWPNLLPHLLVLAFLEMGTALILLAELGFLGIFMGGSSQLQLDIGLGGGEPPPVYVIPEMPEWGALVAQGARFIRGAPHLVWGPALAFLLAVMGLNAFGEGLRRLLDYTSVSTAFLLRKQMALVLALFVGGSALLLEMTGPQRSYALLAGTFDGERAYQEARRLAQGGGQTAAFRMAQTLEEYDVEPGYPQDFGKSYLQTFQAQSVRPLGEPLLAVLDEGWRQTQTFAYGEEFGYALEGAAGAGEAVAPVTLAHFRSGDRDAYELAFEGMKIRDRVVLLSQAPPQYVDLALRRGARGVMVLAEDVSSQGYVGDEESAGPVFYVNRDAARSIAAAGGNDLDSLLAGTEAGATRVYGDLGVTVHMALNLAQPQTEEVPAVIGFLPGYDQKKAAEIVILFTTFAAPNANSEPSTADFLEAGVLLEMVRSWQERGVDPRRSLLLVAWGGDPVLASGYFAGQGSFRELVARVPTAQLHPAAILHYEEGSAGGVWVDPLADDDMQQVLEVALVQSEAGAGPRPPQLQSPLMMRRPRYTYLYWGTEQASGDGHASPGQALGQLGELLSHSLIRMTREEPW